MENETILDLANDVTLILENNNIYPIDVKVFVYDLNNKLYEDFESIGDDICSGQVLVYFSIEALIGDGAWDFLYE